MIIVTTIIIIIIIYYYYYYYYYCYYYDYYAGSVAAFRQGRQLVPGSGPMASQGGGMRQQQLANSPAGVRQAGTTGSKAPLPPTELPYHRFKAGESILISNSKGQEVRC